MKNAVKVNTYKLYDRLPQFRGTFIPDWLMPIQGISRGVKLFYGAVARIIGNKGSAAISTAYLADKLGVSVRQVVRYAAAARTSGLIIVQRRGQGKDNLYSLKLHPAMDISLEAAAQLRIVADVADPAGHRPGSDHAHQIIVAKPEKSLPEVTSESLPLNNKEEEDLSQKLRPGLATVAKSPQSRHEEAVCERFALAERAKKGNIKSVPKFTQWLYWTGLQDAEIDRYLETTVKLTVGSYGHSDTIVREESFSERIQRVAIHTGQYQIKCRECFGLGIITGDGERECDCWREGGGSLEQFKSSKKSARVDAT